MIFFRCCQVEQLRLYSRSQETATEYRFTKVAGLKACDLIKNKTPTQVFFCEYCEIFKNIHFEEHLRTAASGTLCLFDSGFEKTQGSILYSIIVFLTISTLIVRNLFYLNSSQNSFQKEKY